MISRSLAPAYASRALPRLPGRHRHSGRRRPAVRGAPLPDSLRCADAGLVGSGDTCDNQVASGASKALRGRLHESTRVPLLPKQCEAARW